MIREETTPSGGQAAAAGGQPASPVIVQVPSRICPAASAYITSVGLHPVEPFQVVGLSSGEVCLYTASTDALSWLMELDADLQAQLRLDHAMRVPASAAHCTGAAEASIAVAPPEHPLKVLSFASLSSSSAAAGGCAVVHCGFLRGREDDLLREVVQRRQPNLASSSSVARHLLYVVTTANDVFVADIKSEVVLVRWNASTAAHNNNNSSSGNNGGHVGKGGRGGASSSAMSATSPLHPQFLITQVETYAALLFITVARRSAIQAASAALGKSGGGGGDRGLGHERNALDHCNEPVAYVLHWGYTNPFAAVGTKGLVAGGGAFAIKAVSHDKQKLRDPAQATASRARSSLSIRAHPFAPLLMLILNRAEVQVYAVDGDDGDVGPKKAQLVLFNSPLSSTSLKAAARATASTPPAPLLDAQFVPSAAVLVRNTGQASTTSSSTAARRRWSCRNVQILLMSSTRLRLVCTRPAFTGETAAKVGTVAVDRVFYAAPETAGAITGAGISGAAPPQCQVLFLRAWTWLASPDTFFVLQSDRTLLELSCNDFVAASMEVPSVRSRRLLPPRTVLGSSGKAPGDWWLLPATASGLPCAQCPDVLPLWGRGSVLSGVFAPRLPAYHADDPQALVFSRLTGLSRPLPISQQDDSETAGHATEDAQSTFHLSLLADTETVSSRCVSIRLCLTPQLAASATVNAGASPDSSVMPARRMAQESVNVNIARVLCESAAPALCRLEHGFYFVGSREESAYSDYPFLVAGLQYVDSTVYESGAVAGAPQDTRDAQLRVAMVCLPADRRELRRLYDTAKEGCGSGSGDGCDAFTPALTLSAELKRTLRQAVQHTQVQNLPIPQFDFELPQAGKMTKQLVSCAFQLSNDGVVPCVWGLWAPVFPHSGTSASSATATMGSSLPAPQSLQLTMQSFYVAAESQQLLWRAPELVQMDDLLASNPSQVFALNSVLTKGGSTDGSAVMASLPAPYTSLDDVLLDVDAAVVARLFLWYADRKVLVLATVETGSSREAGFDSEVIDDAYNFASRARNGRVMGGRLFTGGGGAGASAVAGEGRGDGRQYLRLVPHAAAEMNDWKGDNTAESLSCTLLSAVQLSVVMVNDHGEPALQVAITSRRFGVALALFPLAGRRGTARVSTALQPVKVYLYRRWGELLSVTAAVTMQAEESQRSRQDASGDRGGQASLSSPMQRRRGPSDMTALGMDDVQHSPLLRRYRTWVDTIAYPGTTYAAVPLVQWVWPPAWTGDREEEDGNDDREDTDETEARKPATTATAAANPILLLQRGRAMYVLHHTGAAVQVCSSLLHCSPLQIVPRVCPSSASSASLTARGEVYLQHGSYPGLLARNRLLRHLQLQYGPYAFYADAMVSSQSLAVKVKWFKKFLKSANSSEAARRRVQERPRQTAWLQRVYGPSPEDLAYAFTSASAVSGTKIEQGVTPQVSAALERLVGSGVTHVCNVIDVNFTDPIRLATLAVEALAASQGMQQLVSAAGMLTDTLRGTLQHLTAVLSRSGSTAPQGGAPSSGKDATPMSVMRGNWAVAEALARLPLGCVMEVMGQEVRRAAAAAAAVMPAASSKRTGDGAGGGISDVRKRRRLADVQRWWWLLMRSSALVTAVNAVQTDTANRVMTRVFDELPLDSPLLQPPADEAAVTATVCQALLLCSPRFMPHVVKQMLRSGTTSEGQQVQRFEAAVREALAVLGARETAAATPATPPSQDEGDDGEAKKNEGRAANSSWSALFSTVHMDGAHWTHAVYYTNLLTHIRTLAQSNEKEEDASSEAAHGKNVAGKVRAMAMQCLAGADAAVEASAAAVLDVATQTVGVFLGAVVDVPAASRSRMANAVAQSMSKRQQVLQSAEKVGGVPQRATNKTARGGASTASGAAAVTNADVPVVDEDVYFLNQTPIDQLRHALYAAQWRDLYGAFAYPTRYFFRSAAASGAGSAGTLPYQLAYDASMSGARSREAATNAPASVDASPSGASRHHRGRVQKVLLTEETRGDAAVVPPTMEIVHEPSSPHVADGDGVSAGAREAVKPQSPLSLRAAVAKEEADLHKTYFNGFAAREDGDDVDDAKKAEVEKAASYGGAVSNDSLARKFQAQLEKAGAAEDGSASAVQRDRQKTAERQRVPDASAFAPSATRRATGAAAGVTPGSNAYGDNLYGDVPSQKAFFARFQGEDEE